MSYNILRGENIQQEPEDRTKCPECKHDLINDNHLMESYCSKCGLIATASITYTAGQKIDLPYGLQL